MAPSSFVRLVVAWVCLAAALPAVAQDRVLRPFVPPLAVAAPEQRIALVIGNGKYRDSPLGNPVNDARAVAKALTRSGFQVTQKENAGRADMQAALREFGDALRKGGVGLFYYAGHGVQVKGRNFLIPVDANIEREDEVAYHGVDANQVLDKMEAANNRINIVILDACRNNPFVRQSRSRTAGLAQMDAPAGSFIAFATAPGSVASDGQGEHGLYTQHLLRAMLIPGVKIEDVFKKVRSGVRRDSGGQQVPWENTSLEGDFVFVPMPAKRPVASVPGPERKIGTVPAPSLRVGDQWTYQTIDLLSGSVTSTRTLTLTAVEPDSWRFGEGYVTDRSWNLLHETKDGKLLEKWTPRRPTYRFPLEVGKTWTETAVRDAPDREVRHTYMFKVIRQERILVPGGVFDTLRVEGSNKYSARRKKDGSTGEGTGVHRYWYSPVAARVVAYEYEETNWKGVVHRKDRLELVSYRRRGNP